MQLLSRMIAISSTFVMPLVLHAQGFVPISDIPNGAVDTSSTDSYLGSLFIIFISVATILAVIKLMICGIQYMTSESISSKGAARTCITYVIGGLLLILISFLILNTINPDLRNGSFNTITESIQDSIGDVSNLPDDVALDGDSGAGAGLPGSSGNSGDWTYTWRGKGVGDCSQGETEERFSNVFACRLDQKSTADVPIYVVEEECADNGSGSYSYTLINQCRSSRLSQSFGSLAACSNSLSEQISLRAYQILKSCFDRSDN